MARYAVSGIVRSMTHSCSGFGHYFMRESLSLSAFLCLKSTNCRGCPDCSCEEGPSVEEVPKDC